MGTGKTSEQKVIAVHLYPMPSELCIWTSRVNPGPQSVQSTEMFADSAVELYV